MAETLTAGEALIALRATSDKLSADMAAASSKITSELQKIEKSAASIDFGKVFEGGLKAAAAFAGGIAAVGTAATALALQSVKTGDEINRMSQAFGISAEELSGLKMAAEDVDVSFSQVQVGLKTLANQAADAAAGNEAAARTFEALGIAVTDANGNLRPTGDLLADVADKMAGMQDGAGKTAIATQLLGRSGQDLIPVLNGGSAALRQAAEEAKGLGVAFDTEAAAAAAALDDQLDKLGHQIGGVANEIGQSLMPIVSEVVGEVSGWIAENRTLMSQSVQQWVTGVKVVIEGMLPIVQGAAKAFNDLGEAIFGASSATGIAGLTSQIQKTEAAMQDLVSDNKFWWLQSEATTKASEEYKHLELTLASLQQQLAHAKGEAVAGAKAFDQLAGDTDKAAGSAGDAGNNFGKLPPPIIKTGDAAKKAADANERLAESIDKLKLDALADDLDDATKAMERSKTVVADENYLRALQDIEAAYNAQVEAARKAADEAVKAGADKARAAEMEALEVDKAQRKMAAAVEKLNEPLQKNAEYWDDLGVQLSEMSPELAVISPQFAALSVATGHASLATFGLTEATKEVSPAAQAASGTISDLSKAIVGLLDNTTDAGDVLQAFAGGLVDNLGGAVSSALSSSKFGKDLTSSLSGVFGPALGEAIATAGMSAVVQIGAGIFMSGVKDAMEGEATSSAAKIGFVVGGPIGAAIGVGIVEAFGIGDKSMIEQISSMLGEMMKASFESDAVTSAINEGLESVGTFLGPGLEKIMIRAPKDMGAQVTEAWKKLGADSSYQFSEGFYQDMKEKGKQLIHSSIGDVLHALFPQISKDLEVGIQQSAVAAGSAIAKEMGLLGDKAIKFANQWATAFIGMSQKAGLSADEILVALHRIDSSLGTSQELVASLQRLQAVLIESGADMDALFSKINEQLTQITGKKVKVGNLDEVLAAVGGDASRALGVIENAMEMAGIEIENFTGELSDVVLAISGDAGTAIREAGEDFRRFGNEADGTAEILRQKVLTALDNVIQSAEELGYTAESIDAFKTAVGLIPPEMLKSSEFVNALRDDFARMAAESHMSVQELVDSIDPPLPAAMRNAILSAHDLGVAIGALAGAPLSSLKEVTDRMKQFAGDMYTYAEEGGKQVKKLTAFGEQLVGDTVSAINGMWDTIAKDGQASQDEIYEVFAQIANIPEETLGDPAVQAAVQGLLAKIGEQTGDAFIIGLSALPEVTKEQLDQALGIYEEWKQDVENNPPEVAPEVQPPENPDGTPADPNAPTGPDTTPASTAPPPQPIPPETLKSWEEINGAAIDYAKAVTEGRDAVLALSADTVTSAAAILAAIKPIYGTPEDDGSFSSIERIAHDIAKFLPEVLTPAFKDFGIEASHAVSSVYEAAVNAKSAMDSLAGTYEVVVKYVTEGSPGGPPSGGACNCGPGGATGGWVPGSVGEPFPMVAHGGEFILPADIAQRVIGGGAMPSNATTSFGAPSATQSAPADPDYALIPVRKRDLIEGAVLEVARATQTGRAHVEGRQIHVSPTYGRRR